MKLGMTAATPEKNDGFQTPNRRHQVLALAAAEAATAMHQERQNIASHPLKIIAISIIFCGNFQ
jgi:hypothetical protein